MIALIDYGAGNIRSVSMALDSLGHDFQVVSSSLDLSSFESIVIPGVGSFKSAMNALLERGLVQPIESFAQSGKRVLGICLGMQLLFESSTEFGFTPGLGLISGRVAASPVAELQLLPTRRVGWGKVNFTKEVDVPAGEFFFAHSFEVVDVKPKNLIGTTRRGSREVVACVLSENIVGAQFHPEKSSALGLRFLEWALGDTCE